MSPLVMVLLADASPANSVPPGTVAAAATPTPLKNDRRPTTHRHCMWTNVRDCQRWLCVNRLVAHAMPFWVA